MNYSKIGTIEAVFLICIGLLNHAILYLPQSIFEICGKGAVINIIYICVLVLIFICLYMKWYKYFHGKDILDISKYLGGNILKYITGILFIAFFLIMTSIMLRNFAESIYITYFRYIDFKIILLMFFIMIFLANLFGKSSIIRCNTIITVCMLISLFVLFLSIVTNIDISKMFPIFGNGIPSIFVEGISNLYAFSGICILFFISPMLKDPASLNKVTIIAFCIMSTILFIAIVLLLLGYSFLLYATELSPVYLLVKSIEFGQFFQNPESLFVLVWILSIISFVCVFSMVVITIIQKLLHFKDSTALSGVVTNILFILALLPRNSADVSFMSSELFKNFQIFIIFIYSILVLGLAYMKKRIEKNSSLKEVQNE